MTIRVKALRDGFYGGERRRTGAVFSVESEKELGRWMKPIGAKEEAEKSDSEPAGKAESTPAAGTRRRRRKPQEEAEQPES